MDFDDWTITDDYSYFDILEEERETISFNDEVLFKTKKEIWIGRLMLIPYSNKKENGEHLKIKWAYTRK